MLVRNHTVYEHTYQLRDLTQSTTPEKSETFFTDKFELKPRKNVRITVTCPHLNGYLVAEGDLVQDSNGMVQPFLIPLTHYKGVEEGEEWTEGEHEKSETLSAQPGGTYSIKLEVEKERANLYGPITVKVEQGASSGFMWFLVFIAIVAFPIGVGIYHFVFNSTRWSNSSLEPPEDDPEPGIELESAKYLKPPPLAIDEPIPMADEIVTEERPVGRVVKKKKKKRPRDDDEEE